VPLSRGELGQIHNQIQISHNVAWAEVYFRTKWRLHPSSRFATIDMGRKLRGYAPFRGSCDPI